MTRSKDVDPTGQFERAQAEVAGISHEAIPPKLDSIEPEAGGLLPCPFCGRHALLHEHGAHTHSDWLVKTTGMPKDVSASWSVECVACSCGLISDEQDDVIAAWNRRASPAPVAVPAGYRLVPEEPTWEMQIAGRDALIDAIDDDNLDTSTDDAKAAYRAMLAASPVPSTATQAGAVTRASDGTDGGAE